MSLNLNKVVLAGRLTADPELKTTTSGTQMCIFTVAIDRRVKADAERITDFIPCVAWEKTAEFITRYFLKGQAIYVGGELQSSSWTDQLSGQKRSGVKLSVREASFVENKAQPVTDTPTAAPVQPLPTYRTDVPLEEVSGDSELPF